MTMSYFRPPRVDTISTNVLVSVAAIIHDRGKVLMILEGEEPYNNQWVIPMGYVHARERILEAVAREVMEEVGVDIQIERLVGVYDDFLKIQNSMAHHVIICYSATPVANSPAITREAKEFAWTDRKNVPRLPAPNVVKEMLTDYYRNQRGGWRLGKKLLH